MFYDLVCFWRRVYFVYDVRKIDVGPNIGRNRVRVYPMSLFMALIKSWIYYRLLIAKEKLKKTLKKLPEAVGFDHDDVDSREYKLWELACLAWIDNWTKDYQRIVGPWAYWLFWGMKEENDVSTIMDSDVRPGSILQKRPNRILPKLVLKKCSRDTTISDTRNQPMRNNRLKRKQVVKR